MAVYVVDANFFIQAHRTGYPLDIAVSFWKTVNQLAYAGKIISIDKVKKEIYRNEDALKRWCDNNLPEDFFKDSSEAMEAYRRVSAWAVSKSSHYKPRAINEFLDADEADAFLVAYALSDPVNRIIVTQEISQPQIKSKIKIPEACNAFNISYINTIQMFRQLKASF